MKFTADFETTTNSPANVWAWGICSIDNPETCYFGETIESFFNTCKKLKNPTLYFHNLKFDGNFILYQLLTTGYTWKISKVACNGKNFTTIISDDGKFYGIDVYFSRNGKHAEKVTFYDSLKLLNMPVEAVAKAFNLPIRKGSIDYDRHNIKCDVTADEWAYLKNDVQIMAYALKEMFEHGFNKITIGSCALSDYKNDMGKKFEKLFPVLDIEADSKIRMSYKGGYTYANPQRTNEDIGNGIVFDVNSLYPSVMAYRPLPYGIPIEFSGQYKPCKDYPLYIQNLRCFFELKENHLPTIQLKHNRFFNQTEYLNSSHGEYVELCLTSPDLELFFKHYNVSCVEYLGGYMFKASTKLFIEWVEKWNSEKVKAAKEGNKGKRTIAKLMLNNLYGKFSLNPYVASKFPYYDEKAGVVKYKLIEYDITDENGTPQYDEQGHPKTTTKQLRTPVYIPVGTFITAWARYTTITASQAIHEKSIKETGKSRYLYSDTDSIHLEGFTVPECIAVHDTDLGKWKLETHFKKARFIQAKRYIEDEIETDENGELITDENGEYKANLKITCAGMPKTCYQFVTWDNFKVGANYDGKLKPLTVAGGVILVPTPFTLSEKY